MNNDHTKPEDREILNIKFFKEWPYAEVKPNPAYSEITGVDKMLKAIATAVNEWRQEILKNGKSSQSI